jgi:hypothetical protein
MGGTSSAGEKFGYVIGSATGASLVGHYGNKAYKAYSSRSTAQDTEMGNTGGGQNTASTTQRSQGSGNGTSQERPGRVVQRGQADDGSWTRQFQ